MIQIYNSLTRKQEPFEPIQPGKVRMYVCGMTVYDYCHLGHARAMVVFDMVSRYFRARGYEVDYVRNITDIDDKIINRANENGETITSLTERFIEAMNEDAGALGVLAPSAEPKATESIELIVRMIESLMEKNAAYQGKNGDIYARVDAFSEYGKLSGKRLEDLRAGERVEVDESKESPYDFVLWKSAKPGEPKWDSPWGEGRPGWHIECSAMSMDLLGETFDIHGGGLDLQFPHHENEIMLSEVVTGKPFARYWMHNGHVKVQSKEDPEDFEKMSKSLGNFFTIRDILKHYRAEEVRFLLLSSHYRSPLNYSEESLKQARQTLSRFYLALRDIELAETGETGAELRKQFFDAMDSDLNTPKAIAVLSEVVVRLNRSKADDLQQAAQYAGLLKELAGILGLLETDPETFFQSVAGEQEDGLSDEAIDELVAQRQQARSDKNWAEADRIRDELKAKGIVIEDGAGTTTWRRE